MEVEILSIVLKKSMLRHGIEIMGFVDDLDSELKSSLLSIVPHNRFSHKVSHTRVLHNWYIGLPLILFKESALLCPNLLIDLIVFLPMMLKSLSLLWLR